MINIIKFLEENPLVLTLLKDKQISLIGVTHLEQLSILEAFEEELCLKSRIWG